MRAQLWTQMKEAKVEVEKANQEAKVFRQRATQLITEKQQIEKFNRENMLVWRGKLEELKSKVI